MKITATITGIDEAIGKLELLKKGARGKHLRKAVRAGAAPQVKAVRAAMTFNDDTGQLRRSIVTNIKTYPSGVTSAAVGPRKHKASVEVYSRSKGRTVKRNPDNYAHLVEEGHRIAVSAASGRSELRHILKRKGKDRIAWAKISKAHNANTEARNAGNVAGRHFLRRGFEQSAAAAQSAFTARFVQEMLGDSNG